jgi:hypothetical protein
VAIMWGWVVTHCAQGHYEMRVRTGRFPEDTDITGAEPGSL